MNAPILKLRVFVSSPGDVGAERAVAIAVSERLQLEFRGQVQLETFLWERSVLRATKTFQEQIIDIGEVDLALFILWSRIGTPLPIEQFARADGSQYMSGTEYEFERARAAFLARGGPEILCYLKTAEIGFSLKDREERSRRNLELDEVSGFVDRWFRNPDGTFKSAFYNFETTAQFEEQVEIHLRSWIRERLRGAQGISAERTVWSGSPFRGLQIFDFDHALIYCGRTQIVADVLDTLRRRAAAGRPFLLITGMSGVGKSSLVRAGVVPLLTRPSVVEGVFGWRRAAFRPNVARQRLLQSFAAALLAPEALPDLTTAQPLEEALLEPAVLTNAVLAALDVETRKAREARPDWETEGTVRLILVVDQFEEIFDEGVAAAERDAFAEALRALVLTGRVWVLATLRADFFSRAADLPERFRDLFIDRGGLFALGGPRTAEIVQMIRRPAAMAGLTFERRGEPEEGLDDVLRDAAAGNPTVLPLLEFTLDELWRRSGGSGVLRFSDYEEIGGLNGALRLRADEQFDKLPAQVQASLPHLLGAMVHIDPLDDRRILQNRVLLSQFDELPACRRLIEAFVGAHLLVVDEAADGSAVVALAHEALLREWLPAVRWIESNREALRLRASITVAAALWRESDRHENRLLGGQLLKDGVALLKASGTTLVTEERYFIRRSAAEAARLLRRTVLKASLAIAGVLIAILIPVIGVEQLVHSAAVMSYLPRVWGEQDAPPLSGAARANLRASIADLSAGLRDEIVRDATISPWSMAQFRAALSADHPADGRIGPDLRTFMSEARDPGCTCWRESAAKPPNEMATAWVLLSLALYDQPATEGELRALLNRQSKSGWWSIFPGLPVDRNASVGVTALVLLALQAQLDHRMVSPDLVARAQESIAAGVAWLRGKQLPDEARWPPYPPPPIGIWEQGDYPGLSGFVHHALRRITGVTTRDALWLEQLPEEVPDVRRNEISKANLLITERIGEIDDSRTYRYPWMLVATVESYGRGSAVQRARALLWIEEALSRPLKTSAFLPQSWLAAEVLFALREVEARLEGRVGPEGADGSARSERFKTAPAR